MRDALTIVSSEKPHLDDYLSALLGGDAETSAMSIALRNTASSIASVRRPVNVFCWLG